MVLEPAAVADAAMLVMALTFPPLPELSLSWPAAAAPVDAGGLAMGVYVTVRVERATVMVTGGGQLAPPAPPEGAS